MSESNDTSNDSNSRGESILQSSRLTFSNPRLNYIRPSVLSNINSSNASSNEVVAVEKPIELLNPFLKEDDVDSANDADSKSSEIDSKNEKDERPDPLSLLNKNGIPKSNLFASAKSSMPGGGSSSFVFGQNVHERVVGDNVTSAGESSERSEDSASSLFAKVIQKSEAEGVVSQSGKESETKSLDEAAREYEESRAAQKRKYEEVETFTGEEDEVNIVDVSCKLFAFVNSNWEERGRGSLRLNDSKSGMTKSRVVFRTCGNLRVVVNTKVWPNMVCDRASAKSLRFTAIDCTGQVKIWLVTARPNDIQIVVEALHTRVELQKFLKTDSGEVDEQNNSQNGKTDIHHEQEEKIDSTTKCSDNEDDNACNDDDNGEPSPKKVVTQVFAPSNP